MKRIVFLGLLSFMTISIYAKLATGEWQMHCAFNDVQQIEQSADKVYAVSDGALFSVDKRDETMEYYTKLSGLSSTNITCIKYDRETKTLLIIYENGNIDLLKSGGIENISDLYNKIMNASKAVNDAVFYNHNAYLATDFGILVLNINKHEIANTCYIGANASEVQIKSVAFIGDVLYAAAADKIYYANVQTNNIVDFSQWNYIPNLPSTGTLQKIEAYNNQLYALMSNKQLYVYEDGSWNPILSSLSFTSISLSGNHLFGSTDNSCYEIHTDYTLDTISLFYNAAEIEIDEATATYWFAARTDGIGMYKRPSIINKYLPEGPIVNIPYNMRFAGEKLFVVPGGRWSDRYNRAPYIMIYENGEWTNINATKTMMPDGVYPTDFVNVAIDPKDDDHFFVTSYGMGLLEYQGTEFIQQYSYNNTILHPAAANNPKSYTRVDGAIFDSKGNLWTGNSSASFSMVVFSPDMKQQATLGNTKINTPGEIFIDKFNEKFKWIVACRGTNIGIVKIDDNGTPFDTNDDTEIFRPSFHDQDHKEVSPEYLYCFAQDKNGDIWVGTYDGAWYISSNTDFFKSDAINRVLIPRNDGSDLYDYLLNGEQVNAIAVDGANRKWFGTANSGVYLMSEDGVETIEHFTSDNSPLPSNNILSIAINPVTGEVFFGTGAGLVSYQSDATEGNEEFLDVYAYPNPVRNDYMGLITITGLIDDANIKITDIAGNLIYETTSNGGVAVWDGKNSYGNKVYTGVYLVQGVSKDGENHILTKILILN